MTTEKLLTSADSVLRQTPRSDITGKNIKRHGNDIRTGRLPCSSASTAEAFAAVRTGIASGTVWATDQRHGAAAGTPIGGTRVPFVTPIGCRQGPRGATRASIAAAAIRMGKIPVLEGNVAARIRSSVSALSEDLTERGLLESTPLLVTSEMGRRPKIGDPRTGAKGGRT